MKNLLLTLNFFLAAVYISNAQPGCPSVSIPQGSNHSLVLPCGSNCTDLSANFFQTGNTSTYTVSSVPFTSFPTGGTPVSANTDDVWSPLITLPFSFCFFDSAYTSVVVGSNGIISFRSSYASGSCPWQLNGVGTTANPIPNPTLPFNSIMGPYQDIDPLNGGNITYQVIGTAPCRIFVVSYNAVGYFSCTTLHATSQIALYETTNVIEVYNTSKVLCTTWNNGNAIEGIQNYNATIAYAVPGRNNVQWTAANDGYRFTPNGLSNVSVSWYQGATQVGTTDTVHVCPPNNATTVYTAKATYAVCGSTPVVVTDTIAIHIAQSAGPDQYVSCPSAVDTVTMAATGTGTWTAVPGNPHVTSIVSPTSPTTVISGFTTPGTYHYVWTALGCNDTADVIVANKPNAGPDLAICVGGIATLAGVGTGTWTAMVGNPAPLTITNATNPTTSVSGFTVGGTYYLIWSFASCTDTMVVTVPIFTVSATTAGSVLCKYQTTTLSVTAAPAALAPFTYLWLDSAIVASPHSATTAITPLLKTNYYHIKVTSSGGCIINDSVQVTLQGAAPRISILPSNDNVCPGDTVILRGIPLLESVVQCGLVDTCTNNALLSNGTVGGTNSLSTNLTSPYVGVYNSAKTQYLIRASELNAAGLSSGSITDLSFFVNTYNSAGVPFDTFTISMACTSLDSLSTFVGGLQDVAPASPYSVSGTGWNPHPFTHFFNWDGTSNIIIQVCYTINPNVGSNSDFVAYTTTTYPSVAYSHSFGGANGCALSATAVSNLRPNLRFGMCTPNVVTYHWSPTTLLCDTCSNTSVIVNKNATYHLTVNNNGCSNADSITIHINPYLAFAAGPDTGICRGDTIQLYANLTNPPPAVCLQNYSVTSIPYNPVSGSGTGVPSTSYQSQFGGNSTDDGTAGPYPIGFSFDFYCQNYSQFYVNSNGWISFVNPYPATSGFQERTAQLLPPTAANLNPQKMIVLAWGDYYVYGPTCGAGCAGVISYLVSGTAPNRTLVVNFAGIKQFGGSGTTTGQFALYENSGIIDIFIQSSTSTGTHTTGIKDSTGIGVAAPGRNFTPYTISTPEGWRFTPQNGPSVVVNGSIWSPVSNLSNPSISNPLAYPSASQDYIVTDSLLINKYTYPEVCKVRDTVHIGISVFNHTLTATPDTICVGTTAHLLFSSTDSIRSYSWTPIVPLSSTTINNPVATVSNNTVIYVTATDTTGCSVHDSITLYTFPHSHPSIRPDQTICYSDSALLQISTHATTYQWYTVDTIAHITSPIATTPSIYGHPSNFYLLKFQDSATTCFLTTDTVHIDSFHRQPITVIPNGPTKFCGGVGGSVQLSISPGTLSNTWTPSIYGGISSFITSTPGFYSYTARDSHNCLLYSDTVRVVVSNFQHTLSANRIAVCYGDTTQFHFNTTSIVQSYNWTPVLPLSIPIISNPVATMTATTTFHVTAIDTSGCIVTDSLTITAYPLLHPSLKPDHTLCYSDSVLLSLAGTYASYQWSRIDSPANTTTVVSNAPTTFAHPLSWYYLNITDNVTHCPYTTDTVRIDSFHVQHISVLVNGAISFCLGDSVHLSTSGTGTNYQWTPSGYGAATTIRVDSTGAFSYTARDINSCLVFSDTVHVFVGQHPHITFAPYTNPLCSSDKDTLIALTTPAGATVNWTYNSVVTPGNQIITNQIGTYYVNATIGICPSADSITLTGAISPVVSLNDTNVCSCNPSIVLTPAVSTPVSYHWSDSSRGSSYTDTSIGRRSITVTVTDNVNHCTATATAAVRITCVEATAVATPDTVSSTDEFLLSASPSDSSHWAYHWVSDTSLGTPYSWETKAVPRQHTGLDTFYVYITDTASGCSDTVMTTGYVIQPSGSRMASAFTPNGDNKNQHFYPVLGVAKTAHVTAFRIYNRWGEMVYDNVEAPGWDGTYKGEPQPTETYSYFVTIESPDPQNPAKRITKSATGNFQLFR